jgi:hypothetical protein
LLADHRWRLDRRTNSDNRQVTRIIIGEPFPLQKSAQCRAGQESITRRLVYNGNSDLGVNKNRFDVTCAYSADATVDQQCPSVGQGGERPNERPVDQRGVIAGADSQNLSHATLTLLRLELPRPEQN